MPRREETTLPNIEYTTAAFDGESKRLLIDRIVIHTTVGTINSAIATFSSGSKNTSAHYIVDLDGKLYQGLEEYNIAFHSGNYQMNQRSIGIEHVDNGQYTAPRTDALYDTAGKLVADICKFYSIPCDRQHVIKHNEVTATGCPHNLDIDRIIRQANLILNPNADCPTKLKEMTVKYEEKCKLETELRGVITKKDEEIKRLNETLANLNSTIEAKNRQIADLEGSSKKLSDDLSGCQFSIQSKTEQANKLPEKEQIIFEQERKINELKENVESLNRAIGQYKTKWEMLKLPYSKLLKKLLIEKLA